MKALIIDDEPPVITVVRLLVNWEKYDITEVFSAGSAEEGMRIIAREHPEIILSDINLPDMNGLDLIEKLQETDPAARIVIISAFDKFSYAQKAVQLGCVEYLLKPLQRERVNQAVEKAVQKYREDSELQSGSRMNRVQSMLSLYLSSGQPPELMEQITQLLPWMKGWRRVSAGIIPMGYLPDEAASLYTIQEAANRFVSEKQMGVASVWGSSSDIILLLDGDQVGLAARCESLLSVLEEQFGLRLLLGLSAPVPFPGSIEEAYRMAQEAAVSANLLEAGERVTRRLGITVPLASYEWISNSLFAQFPSAGPEALRRELESLAGRIAARGQVSIRQLENFRASYNSVRSRCMQHNLREKGEEIRSIPPFQASFCLGDGGFDTDHFCGVLLTDLLVAEKMCLANVPAPSIADICRRAKEYIQEHYREEISMEELAKRYSISASYLSRSFKREMGIGMNEYLTAVRIEAAKKLLQEGRRSAEVGEAVGFLDPKYFSRVFRRETGRTPSEYRRGSGREETGV